MIDYYYLFEKRLQFIIKQKKENKICNEPISGKNMEAINKDYLPFNASYFS
jgi:hypothetical protein